MTHARPLEERFWEKVNKTSSCWEWTAHRDKKGYGRFQLSKRVSDRAHRVAYRIAKGDIPAGMQVDHQCRNKGCVNPSHLRLATNKENAENHGGARANSQSGIRGVSWYPRKNKWNAQVCHNWQQMNLGYFENIEDAAAAVLAKRLELFTRNEIDRAA